MRLSQLGARNSTAAADSAAIAAAAVSCAHGHAVDEVADLATAESFVRSYAYDAFVLDRGLPDGDALTVLRQ